MSKETQLTDAGKAVTDGTYKYIGLADPKAAEEAQLAAAVCPKKWKAEPSDNEAVADMKRQMRDSHMQKMREEIKLSVKQADMVKRCGPYTFKKDEPQKVEVAKLSVYERNSLGWLLDDECFVRCEEPKAPAESTAKGKK